MNPNAAATPLTGPQIAGMLIAAIIAMWVILDATRRGKPALSAVGWGVGVFLALILFLPLYLFFRGRESGGVAATKASQAATPCRYCGLFFAGDPDYCPHCQKQLKSSTEIHPTP